MKSLKTHTHFFLQSEKEELSMHKLCFLCVCVPRHHQISNHWRTPSGEWGRSHFKTGASLIPTHRHSDRDAWRDPGDSSSSAPCPCASHNEHKESQAHSANAYSLDAVNLSAKAASPVFLGCSWPSCSAWAGYSLMTAQWLVCIAFSSRSVSFALNKARAPSGGRLQRNLTSRRESL